jgi:hypothetical protein
MPSELETITTIGRRPHQFRCPICFKGFDAHKALYHHQLVHRPDYINRLPVKYILMSEAARRRGLREKLLRWEAAIHGAHYRVSEVLK